MSLSLEPPATALARDLAPIRIDPHVYPYLPDHGFQGLVVVPGAFYLSLASQLVPAARTWAAAKFTEVDFVAPLLLADQPIDLVADLRPVDEREDRFSCAFSEALARAAGEPPATTFRLAAETEPADHFPRVPIAPEFFFQNAAERLDRETFYRRLRENGNQYGPQFQGLQRLARRGDELIARLELARIDPADDAFALNPIAVDAAIQALMMFGLDAGRTLVLQSIEQVLFRPPARATEGWIAARRRTATPAGPEGVFGDVEVWDETGTCWLALRGVRLTAHAAAPGARETAAAAALDVVVAATFTAEPIAEVFKFWSDTLARPTRLEFAPYGQVFQQLLDPGSAFHRNRTGCNVLLVNLADWAAGRAPAPHRFDRANVELALRGLDRCTLPNGLEIAQLNRHETDYVYREIFQDRCYLRHGIQLPDTGTVIDIGANIGLFSLFVRGEAPGVSVLAYEPSPAAFRALAANCAAYGPGLRAFNAGVAERRGEAVLTSYEQSSVFSTFHADHAEDRQAIRAVAANVARAHAGGEEAPADVLDELLADRLNARTVTCPVLSVSDIFRENDLRRVELLKIDAEKCELEILRGIADEHWPLIDQIVIEVHDRTRALLDDVTGLLARRGFHCAVVEENLLTGSGLFNVYAIRGDAANPAPAAREGELTRVAHEFVDALATFAQRTTSRTLLALVPDETQSFAGIERELLHRVRALPRVQALGAEELLARYPARAFYQPDGRQLGHLPYSPDGFAAIGTGLFRLLAAAQRRPLKVIALDCDHTLWAGGSGEDGPRGVVVTAAHRALQEFMLRQREAGRLLCLCSKNDPATVWAVFEQNPAMVLRPEHVTAARINWSPKSENLRSLAAELNVGLESIVLLDDNPLECAEVRAHCPEVLVLPVPAAAERIPHWLDHLWLFDQASVTAEDRARARMMGEGARREEFRQAAPTLESFIAGLGLQVTISPPEPAQLERLAQLTQRTNQFNTSTVRRTEGELRQWLENPAHRALAVQVTDRFGDYGLVGAVLYARAESILSVDTLLLSCRVLGRGVEHHVLAELGQRARAEEKTGIEIAVRSTDKNQPARDFLASLGSAPADTASDGAVRYRLASDRLAGLRFSGAAPAAKSPAAPARREVAAEPARRAENFEMIAAELDDAHKIAVAVEAHRLRAAGFGATGDAAAAPATLSGKLLQIWRRILGRPHIGPDDRFMEVGGTSLAAVQIVAAVRRELELPLSVVAFFECPTVRRLSEKLAPTGQADAATTGAASSAIARGARRAQRMRRGS